MSTILDQLKARHGLPQTRGTHTMSAEGKDIPQRLNYMTCGNIVELTTEIIHSLSRKNVGRSNQLGEERLLKRDFAALVASRLTRRIEAANQNRG